VRVMMLAPDIEGALIRRRLDLIRSDET
jgi:hypothetical protein